MVVNGTGACCSPNVLLPKQKRDHKMMRELLHERGEFVHVLALAKIYGSRCKNLMVLFAKSTALGDTHSSKDV